MEKAATYRIGIDVGLGGVGLAAIAVDPDGVPSKILNAQVVTHDSGVDPESQKTGVSRLAVAGIARRVRRLVRRRRKRLQNLDRVLGELGFPIINIADQKDSYLPWRMRSELAKKLESDPELRKAKVSIAVRHMARHRGWRNPYASVANLHFEAEDSKQFIELKQRISSALGGLELGPGLAPGEVVALHALTPSVKLRGDGGLLGGKLMQSDNANELRKIAVMQGIPADQLHALIEAVFKAESPKGAAAKRAGKDPLPGQRSLPRAPKAHSAFQRFRIVAVLANMRVREPDNKGGRRLSSIERHMALNYLLNIKSTDLPTWADVADCLKIERHRLVGAASAGLDGERPASRPPVDETDRRMRESKLKSIVTWWGSASRGARDAMVEQLAFGGSATDATPEGAEAETQLLAMTEEDLAKLDLIRLPAGRAAYSVESLVALTEQMLESEDDLHDARVRIFHVAPDWTPPAEPVGAPVGNPAVDRVTKIIARWLAAVEREWGPPESVNIEHVREGLSSDVMARLIDRENNRRFEANQRILTEIQQRLGITNRPRRSDLLRYQSISRQNGKCAYCDEPIDYFSAEMDHIVPRAGAGSTNTRDNLLAVCAPCNKSKSNQLFFDWANSCGIPGVSVEQTVERTRHWLVLSGVSTRDHRRFVADVRARLLRRAEDPEIDNRSMESVAWMANELRHRVEQHYRVMGATTSVAVYRGNLTAEARKASGLEGRVALIGGPGKTRFDRRHHVMDAVTIALMEPGVSQTLAERLSMRDSQRLDRVPETWKSHFGSTPGAQDRFKRWLDKMSAMSELLNTALLSDSIPVLHPIRLRLGNGSAHDDTLRKLVRIRLREAMPVDLIDRASTPALWCALTRQPDFDSKAGLPANPIRRIKINGRLIQSDDFIGFFDTGSAAIAVRGGYAEIGSTIHHARLYRVPVRRGSAVHMVRVFASDLLRYRNDDLFNVPLAPHLISVRQAPSALREALSSGAAEYIGWLVLGDELKIDMSSFKTGQIGAFLEEYPGTTRWRVDGFESKSRLRLRPSMLASEGLPADVDDAIRKTVDRPGWLISISKLWQVGDPVVIRRNALGRPRLASDAHLPTTWRAEVT